MSSTTCPKEGVSAGLVAFKIEPGQKRIVVQHLLKMGHQPALVDRITVKASPEMVVHAALRHFAKRMCGHVQVALIAGCVGVAQKQRKNGSIREFGSLPYSAVGLIIVLGQSFNRFLQHRHIKRPRRWLTPGKLFKSVQNLGGRFGDIRGFFPIGLGDACQDSWERGDVMAVLRWEIGSAIERLAIWGEKHRHRPAAATDQHLHRIHIDFINIRPFFPVNLDIDEQLIHQRGNVFVLKGLVRHNVAPVARRIANAQQNRFVFSLGFGKSLCAPRVPVHRVVGMLEQVGARLRRQTVSEFFRHADLLMRTLYM